MKVLLDENFPLPLLEALLREGVDAEHIITLDQRGASDSTIRARLDREAIVFLTNDTEFSMGPMPVSGWVIVSRVKQSRALADRISVWARTVRTVVKSTPASRVNELLDDGQLLPWRDAASDDIGASGRRPESTIISVLGVDVASAAWSSNGSAMISFDAESQQFRQMKSPAIQWPTLGLTPATLAAAIDDYARSNHICAVALDGPQGWRDPDTPLGLPGVGRRCEYECRTQGKTGVYPQTFPGTQRSWIEFCIALFDALLEKPGVRLAEPGDVRGRPTEGYVVLECYPTSAWRSSGLKPLPAKAKMPPLEGYGRALADAYQLPATVGVQSHDDLQAIVAGIVAASAIGGPALAVPCGKPSTTKSGSDNVPHRVEGLIWNVRPVARQILSEPQTKSPGGSPATRLKGAAVKVTQKVLDQVGRGGINQQQIVLQGVPGGTSKTPVTIRLEVDGSEYTLEPIS